MGEKMYGPSTHNCPQHGEQAVRAVGFRTGTKVACGGLLDLEGQWWHAGDVTSEQKDAALARIDALREQYPDAYGGCCDLCAPPLLENAPADVRQEAYRLTDLVAAYHEFAQGGEA